MAMIKWRRRQESLYPAVGTSSSSVTGFGKHQRAISSFAQVWGTTVAQPLLNEDNLGTFKTVLKSRNFCKDFTNSNLNNISNPGKNHHCLYSFSTWRHI